MNAPSRSKRLDPAVVAAVVGITGYVIWIESGVGGPHINHVGAGVFQLVVGASLPSVAALNAARKGGGDRRFWTIVCAALCLYAVSIAFNLAASVVSDKVAANGGTSWSDLIVLACAPVALVGVVLAPTASRIVRIRSLIDAFLVAGSLFFVLWATTPGAHYGSGGADPNQHVAFLASDVLFAVIVMLKLGSSSGLRLSLWFLLAAIALELCRDLNVSYGLVALLHQSRDLADAGGVSAGVLVGLGAIWAVRVPASEGEEMFNSPLHPLLSYGALGAAALVALWLKVAGRTLDELLTWTALGLVALVLLRQYLVVIENLRLSRALGEATARLQHQAFHDSLTGLPNRALFLDRLERSLASTVRSGDTVGVLFVDLDDFKAVNDTEGHDAGDELLRVVALRLQAEIRQSDTAARLGGDEFAILLSPTIDTPTATAIGERIAASLARDLTNRTSKSAVGASVGLALSVVSDSCDALLRRADSVMYEAKRRGKGRLVVHPSPTIGLPDSPQ